MKTDILLIASGAVWVVLLLASLATVRAVPLDDEDEFGMEETVRPSRLWYRQQRASSPLSRGGVPRFVADALEQLNNRDKRFSRVPMGAECRADSECSPDRCCAMKLGKAVCTPRPGRGRTCLINGPTAYSPQLLFTQCPCHNSQCQSRRGNKGVCS